MSELSRMEKHRSQQKGRKKQKKAAAGSRAAGHQASTAPRGRSGTGNPAVSRSGRSVKSPSARSPRDGDRPVRSRSVQSGKNASKEQSTPLRSKTYTSQRVRMSKWFVNSLIILFILLMAGLLVWGLIGAPPLEEII
ncbi:hypothetical protein [Paenibacillus sp. DMB20]|uniref:hypothetical protein n=1 Tax=Paenibacillus sp. DMB20 TaxID=1642570 RepID=UPI00062759AB|nr:hypothetical protein [Paenibacillus sp. DMB20]KKO52025.1 hypothetical protein XI25_21380 [Paenibacillus sp. DMB20]